MGRQPCHCRIPGSGGYSYNASWGSAPKLLCRHVLTFPEYIYQSVSGETGSPISLFFNPVGIKYPLNHLMGLLTDTRCPLKEPRLIPFTVQLMVDRHVLRDCEVLPAATIKTFVAADPIPFVINLNAALGVPDIHFLAHILIRNRIILKIYGNVVVQLNGSGFPLGKLIWISEKRL